MKLHFDVSTLVRLLEHSMQADMRIALRGQTTPGMGLDNAAPEVPPGLWLVGDHGVYLASNGHRPLLIGDGPEREVAYAEEANPQCNPDTSYDVKEAAFGGDDGIVFVRRSSVMMMIAYSRDGKACINLTPTSLSPERPLAVLVGQKGPRWG